MGTRFLATKEAPIHENIKRAIVEGSERDTALVYRPLRNTARVYKNKVAERVNEIDVTALIAEVAALDPRLFHIKAFDLPPQEKKLVLDTPGVIALGEELAKRWLEVH